MNDPKPGYLTTEFWLTLLAYAVSVIAASPLMELPVVAKVVTVIATILAAIGYQVSRAIVKASSRKG